MSISSWLRLFRILLFSQACLANTAPFSLRLVLALVLSIVKAYTLTMCVQKFSIFLLLVTISVCDPIHSWTGISAAAESDCLAPHLHTTISYDFSVYPHLWKDVQHILHNNETADIRVVASTQPLMLANYGRSWLHNVEVKSTNASAVDWLSAKQKSLKSESSVRGDLFQNLLDKF